MTTWVWSRRLVGAILWSAAVLAPAAPIEASTEATGRGSGDGTCRMEPNPAEQARKRREEARESRQEARERREEARARRQQAREQRTELRDERREAREAVRTGAPPEQVRKELRDLIEARRDLARARQKAREARRAAIRARLRAAKLTAAPPALRAELARHARRMAWLARAHELAETANDSAAVERITGLAAKERDRHEAWMARHVGAAPGGAP